MSRTLPAIAALVAVVACGVVHGVWTDRWHLTNEPAASAARLANVGLDLPDWKGVAVPGNLGKDMAGVLHHRYTHRKTGKSVTVFMLCDRPGPVSIHTPDVCYGGVGYEVTTPLQFTAKGAGDPAPSLWTARFRKQTATENSDLRIFWSWNAGAGWQAADDPRLTFAHHNALFKLYLIHEGAGSDATLAEDPSAELLQQLAPELQRALFPPQS